MRVFDNRPSQATQQDFAWEITIPSSEKRKAIRNLALLNISAYSLFLSDESLMETVYLEELYNM